MGKPLICIPILQDTPWENFMTSSPRNDVPEVILYLNLSTIESIRNHPDYYGSKSGSLESFFGVRYIVAMEYGEERMEIT